MCFHATLHSHDGGRRIQSPNRTQGSSDVLVLWLFTSNSVSAVSAEGASPVMGPQPRPSECSKVNLCIVCTVHNRQLVRSCCITQGALPGTLRWPKGWGERSRVLVVQLFVTPWILACQAPLSVGMLQARLPEWGAISFSRGIFLTQGSNWLPWHCQGDSQPLDLQGSLCVSVSKGVRVC